MVYEDVFNIEVFPIKFFLKIKSLKKKKKKIVEEDVNIEVFPIKFFLKIKSLKKKKRSSRKMLLILKFFQ